MRIYCVACAALLAAGSVTLAERAPEDRSRATHVVVGKVERVFVRNHEGVRDYLVEVAVEKVERGPGLKPGGTLYVEVYLWDPDWYKGKKLSEKERKALVMRGPAYDGVPKEGQRVRVYARRWGSKYAGIYPSWYDVLKGK
jgi:hypothetical protein